MWRDLKYLWDRHGWNGDKNLPPLTDWRREGLITTAVEFVLILAALTGFWWLVALSVMR
jgi:hypothetical protein